MSSETLSILQNLTSGAEVRLFADAGALQIAKTGLYIFAAAAFVFAIKLLLTQIGVIGSNRTLLGWLGFAAVAVISFLLYDKAQSFEVIDTNDPVITISAQKLEYDVRQDGWSVNWADMTEVQLNKDVHQQKQSPAQTTYEVRVVLKQGAHVAWKYEPDEKNKVAATKKFFEEKNYLVIDPAPLGVDHETLQKALERYRAGR